MADWWKKRNIQLPDGEETATDTQTTPHDEVQQTMSEARQRGEAAKQERDANTIGELPNSLDKRQQRKLGRLRRKVEAGKTLGERKQREYDVLKGIQDRHNAAEIKKYNEADDDEGTRQLSEALDEQVLGKEIDNARNVDVSFNDEDEARLTRLQDRIKQAEIEAAEEEDNAGSRELSEQLDNEVFGNSEQQEQTQEEDIADETPSADTEPTADEEDDDKDNPEHGDNTITTDDSAAGKTQVEPRDTIDAATTAIQDPTIKGASGARSHNQGHSYYDADKFGIGDIAKSFNDNPILNTYLKYNTPPETPEYNKKKEKRLRLAQFFNLLGGLFNMVDDVATAKNRGVVFNKDYTTRQGILEKFIDQNKALHAKAQENYTEQMKVYRKGLWDAILNDEKHRLRAFEQLVKASSEKYNNGYSERLSLDKFNYDQPNDQQRRLGSANSAWIRHINVNDGDYVILKADFESLMNVAKANMMSNKNSFDAIKTWFYEKYPKGEDIPTEYKDLSEILSAEYSIDAKTRFQKWTEENKSTFEGHVRNFIEAGIDSETSRQAELYIFGDNKGRFTHKAGDRPQMQRAILDYFKSQCPEGSTQPENCVYDLAGIQSKLAGMNLYQLAEAYYDVINKAPEYDYVDTIADIRKNGLWVGNGDNVSLPTYGISNKDIGYSGDNTIALADFDFNNLPSEEKENLRSKIVEILAEGKGGIIDFNGHKVIVNKNDNSSSATNDSSSATNDSSSATDDNATTTNDEETTTRPEYNDSIRINLPSNYR